MLPAYLRDQRRMQHSTRAYRKIACYYFFEPAFPAGLLALEVGAFFVGFAFAGLAGLAGPLATGSSIA